MRRLQECTSKYGDEAEERERIDQDYAHQLEYGEHLTPEEGEEGPPVRRGRPPKYATQRPREDTG